MMGGFPEVVNFNQLFLKLGGFNCNLRSVLRAHWTLSSLTLF